MGKAKTKKCNCCGAKVKEGLVVPKTKFVDINSSIVSQQVYRITFECCSEDIRYISDEIRGYGTIIKEEKEVIDNG